MKFDVHEVFLQYDPSCEEGNQSCINQVWPTQKLVSDAGTDFVSEQFKEFYRCLNTD